SHDALEKRFQFLPRHLNLKPLIFHASCSWRNCHAYRRDFLLTCSPMEGTPPPLRVCQWSTTVRRSTRRWSGLSNRGGFKEDGRMAGRKAKAMKHVGFRIPLHLYEEYFRVAEARSIDLTALFILVLNEFRPMLLLKHAKHQAAMLRAA